MKIIGLDCREYGWG
ncbi:hypothetical protein VCHC52A1_1263, partial [Vibrio cholerae HC-52A1]